MICRLQGAKLPYFVKYMIQHFLISDRSQGNFPGSLSCTPGMGDI